MIIELSYNYAMMYTKRILVQKLHEPQKPKRLTRTENIQQRRTQESKDITVQTLHENATI